MECAYLQADISDDLLREFARDTLGAQRCSEQYLDALRVVLGNQAHAERWGYVLEMNVRVPFASVQTMRTIIQQMQKAGITFGRLVALGQGRSQEVQCFGRQRPECREAEAGRELERIFRAYEPEPAPYRCADITEGDVPY